MLCCRLIFLHKVIGIGFALCRQGIAVQPGFHTFKLNIYCVFECFIFFTALRQVNHVNECFEVSFAFRRKGENHGDICGIQQFFCLYPEIFSGLRRIAGSVFNQHFYKFQNIFLSVFFRDIGKRVIVHGLCKINGIKYLDMIRFIHRNRIAVLILMIFLINGLAIFVFFDTTTFQHNSAFHKNGSFRISYHIGRVHLHDIGLDKETCFTRTGAADHQDILISRIFWRRWFSHGQTFCLCQKHIVFKTSAVHIWLYVFFSAPAGRTIFFTLSELLFVFSFEIQNCFHNTCNSSTCQNINAIHTGKYLCKRSSDFIQKRHQFFLKTAAISNSVCITDFVSGVSKNQIWKIGKQYFLQFFGVNLHNSTSCQ